MKKLPPALSKGSFEGFTLKAGFWYGYNPRGQAVATSGWTYNDYLALYTRDESGTWNRGWLEKAKWCLLPTELKNQLTQ